ncbi:MAG: hypothetical protein TR69_WS6001001510 [candidate division WS6 bacterium OLB20]|uniref:Trigger factor n=1 Tax=candidate division WS6 bacterium OLB20 TaxID=1617426 RepID=A0A136LVS4_9BACT|nr:MAG: hypothetical protein TR69_WS6001001510 [candidate division WS6 bacterium OLB20]
MSQELLFVKIAQEHDLKVTSAEVEAEIAGILDPKLKKEYDNDRGRRYISAVILQQKAAMWLREQVPGMKPEAHDHSHDHDHDHDHNHDHDHTDSK